jgi:hypothetical protein
MPGGDFAAAACELYRITQDRDRKEAMGVGDEEASAGSTSSEDKTPGPCKRGMSLSECTHNFQVPPSHCRMRTAARLDSLQRLRAELNLPEEWAQSLVNSGADTVLLKMLDDNELQVTEEVGVWTIFSVRGHTVAPTLGRGACPAFVEAGGDGGRLGFSPSQDPILCLGLEDTTPACGHFFDNGNYGLPAPVPGGLAWPGGAPPVPGAKNAECLEHYMDMGSLSLEFASVWLRGLFPAEAPIASGAALHIVYSPSRVLSSSAGAALPGGVAAAPPRALSTFLAQVRPLAPATAPPLAARGRTYSTGAEFL